MILIVSDSLDGNEELLIKRAAMFKLFLITRGWPYRCDPSEFREEADKIIKAMQQGTINRCLKAEMEKIKSHEMATPQQKNS